MRAPQDYPTSAPRVRFTSQMFHPNVSPSNALLPLKHHPTHCIPACGLLPLRCPQPALCMLCLCFPTQLHPYVSRQPKTTRVMRADLSGWLDLLGHHSGAFTTVAPLNVSRNAHNPQHKPHPKVRHGFDRELPRAVCCLANIRQ